MNMKKFVVLTTIVLAALTYMTANAAEPDNYFYVNSYENTAAWNGSSNIYDYLHLQDAIKDAAAWSATNSDKEAYVLLAVGSYRISTIGGIAKSLSLKDGVTVIGGFAGTETDTIPTYKQSDDPTGSTTTTSIWANDEMPVFINTGVGPTAVLQNVEVGYGSGYNEGRDCGGGMDNTNSSPTIANCTFLNNITNGNGGSMRNDNSSPTLTNCMFTFTTTQAQAINGGGMYNANGSSPTLTGCTFMNNSAGNNGGGMCNDSDSSPTLISCTFTGNSAPNGGGMENKGNPTLTDCTFTNNTASVGGGMANIGNPSLTNCSFTGNKAISGGGGGLYDNSPDGNTFINCAFKENTADGNVSDGGGLYSNGSATLINCTVTDNKAGQHGGGVNIYNGGTFINCTVTGNTTVSYGGGVNVEHGNATLVGCAVTGNTSNIGVGVNLWSGTLINCTVMGNTASASNSGVFIQNNPSALINCLVALNNNSNAPGDNATVTGGTIKSSVVGKTAYNSAGVGSLFAPPYLPPAVTDFNSDGSLTSDAIYAIKQGDVDLYKAALNTYNVLTTLNAALGASLAAEDMLDINGLPVIDANNGIDIGAFRYPGTVLSVTVKPNSVILRKGQTTTFTAIVDAQNGAGQRVIWSVNSTAGSTIDGNGVLTIAVGETASALTVTATSAENKTQFGTATVKVLDIPSALTAVTANAGYGGTVDNGGSGLTYTVTPNSGFVIDQVFVDGVEQTVSDRSTFTYTFPDDGGMHSIFATFGYTVNFNQPTNGTLTVSSAGESLTSGSIVYGGQALNIIATPANDYLLSSFTINGVDVISDYDNGYDYTVGTSGAKRMLSDGTTEVSAQGADIAAVNVEKGEVITSIDDVQLAKTLKAWTQNGLLHISGLTIGKLWTVYNISGLLVRQSIATKEEACLMLPVKGVYVIVSGTNRVKVVY